MTLESEVPQGDPDSMTCRWCSARRTRVSRGALVCLTCDTSPK